MARPKQIDDKTLLEYIDEYFTTVCQSDPAMLKFPEVTKYIASRGFPGYRVESLRRNQTARAHIEKLASENRDERHRIICTHKTLDVDSFLNNNRGLSALKRALTQLDAYYGELAKAAAPLFAENSEQKKKTDALKAELKKCQEEKRALEEKNEELKETNRQLTKQDKVYQTVIRDYVYPDIANQILSETELKNVTGIIDEHKLKLKLKTKDSVIVPVREISPVSGKEDMPEHVNAEDMAEKDTATISAPESSSHDVVSSMFNDF